MDEATSDTQTENLLDASKGKDEVLKPFHTVLLVVTFLHAIGIALWALVFLSSSKRTLPKPIPFLQLFKYPMPMTLVTDDNLRFLPQLFFKSLQEVVSLHHANQNLWALLQTHDANLIL